MPELTANGRRVEMIRKASIVASLRVVTGLNCGQDKGFQTGCQRAPVGCRDFERDPVAQLFEPLGCTFDDAGLVALIQIRRTEFAERFAPDEDVIHRSQNVVSHGSNSKRGRHTTALFDTCTAMW
jgi:hypothetical protein